MELKDNWYIDSNNNRWSSWLYTKEQAQELSENMICCKDCKNCSNCSFSSGCNDCNSIKFCKGCHHSDNCSYCNICCSCNNVSHCNDCNKCSNSSHLSDCNDCENCNCCTNCEYCNDLRYCYDVVMYEYNPIKYIVPKYGDIEDDIYFYSDHKYNKTQVVHNFFRGNMDEFEIEIIQKYLDDRDALEQYTQEINKAKLLFGMQ